MIIDLATGLVEPSTYTPTEEELAQAQAKADASIAHAQLIQLGQQMEAVLNEALATATVEQRAGLRPVIRSVRDAIDANQPDEVLYLVQNYSPPTGFEGIKTSLLALLGVE